MTQKGSIINQDCSIKDNDNILLSRCSNHRNSKVIHSGIAPVAIQQGDMLINVIKDVPKKRNL